MNSAPKKAGGKRGLNSAPKKAGEKGALNSALKKGRGDRAPEVRLGTVRTGRGGTGDGAGHARIDQDGRPRPRARRPVTPPLPSSLLSHPTLPMLVVSLYLLERSAAACGAQDSRVGVQLSCGGRNAVIGCSMLNPALSAPAVLAFFSRAALSFLFSHHTERRCLLCPSRSNSALYVIPGRYPRYPGMCKRAQGSITACRRSRRPAAQRDRGAARLRHGLPAPRRCAPQRGRGQGRGPVPAADGEPPRPCARHVPQRDDVHQRACGLQDELVRVL